jgi:hypothetical protein
MFIESDEHPGCPSTSRNESELHENSLQNMLRNDEARTYSYVPDTKQQSSSGLGSPKKACHMGSKKKCFFF